MADRTDAYEQTIAYQKANKKYKEAFDKLDERIKNAKNEKTKSKLEAIKEYSIDFSLDDSADPAVKKAAKELHIAQNSFYEKVIGNELDDVNMKRVKYDLNVFMGDTSRAEALIESMKHNMCRSDVGSFIADEIEKRQKYNVKLV